MNIYLRLLRPFIQGIAIGIVMMPLIIALAAVMDFFLGLIGINDIASGHFYSREELTFQMIFLGLVFGLMGAFTSIREYDFAQKICELNGIELRDLSEYNDADFETASEPLCQLSLNEKVYEDTNNSSYFFKSPRLLEFRSQDFVQIPFKQYHHARMGRIDSDYLIAFYKNKTILAGKHPSHL